MSQYGRGKGLLRKSFSKIEEVVYLPNLIEVQSKSFNDFAQLDCLPSERKNIGLEKVFRDTFPIEHDNRISLEYVNYELGDWACICGQLTGIENRYRWQCKSCKKVVQDYYNIRTIVLFVIKKLRHIFIVKSAFLA